MIAKRLENFRKKLIESSIDAALISNDYNRNYLSGFTGDESYILITDSKAYFITDSRFTQQAREEVKDYEVLEYKHSVESCIKDILIKNNIAILGIEEGYVTLKKYEGYRENFTNVEIVKLESLIENLRIIKDESEIELISKAANIADKAFEYILSFIKEGISELDVAIELELYMKKLGASSLSFPTIVASGERSSLPHGVATDKLIRNGDFVTLDFGCVYKGYCSDMTRTVVVGKATEEQKKIYNLVLKANEEALKCAKPGVKCSELDKVARDIIIKGGYGEKFGHGLGHGVGREIHESPRVSPKGTHTLEPGMVITDEPGIYIEGTGGVRIEDLLVITQDGCRVLSKSPKSLIEL
ncbi:M24 family metallopeptidase [Clostridium cylindrosporum]|uniref:Xaa-Pro aminopeptidase n=1 Tax=Clostridium cylindrosporum DSM 605 TaxID=1121307 RepID=A0A0J8G0L3_CLOCY|nr:Xaa-Pro peptidase family protein [Clostridium cylindrosporum]KMT21336.1 Xaa-Pro aminopeptidase [Clostridium cylindrosporum DSM 605]